MTSEQRKEQKKAGIFRNKTMDNKLINIPNNDKQNQPIYRLKLLVKIQ